MQRTKSKASKVTQELLDEKDERIHHLEEVNRTLKQTNDEQAEELGELRAKIQVLTAEVLCGLWMCGCCLVMCACYDLQLNQFKSTSKTLQEESKELIANLNVSQL